MIPIRKENNNHAVNVLKVGCQRKVQQINKDTLEVIKEYQNITIAAKETGTNNTSIIIVVEDLKRQMDLFGNIFDFC